MGIKGKTVFELTDVNTGKVEKHEECNMITNGLQEFLNPCGSWGIYPYSRDNVRNTPLRNTLTGGILLFDSRLEEDVTNTHADASVNMVGNGALGVSNGTSVTELGSYNLTESGVQADGSIKYVYDFLTSQANGTIQSVCLTSKIGGYMGYGNGSANRTYDAGLKNTDYQYSASKTPDCIRFDNNNYGSCMMYAVYDEDAVYVIDPSSMVYRNSNIQTHWQKTKKIRINKYRLGVKTVGLNDYNRINNLIASYDVAIPQDILDYMSTSVNYVSAIADGNTREIFIVFSKTENCNNGSFFWIMKIDSNMQATSYKVTNNTGYEIYRVKNDDGNPNPRYFVDNGYFWCWLRRGDYNLVGIKYADSTQILETDVYISNTLAITKTYDHMLEVGNYYGGSNQYANRNIYNTITKKLLAVNGYDDFGTSYKVLFSDKKGLYLYPRDDRVSLYVDPRYLATINNLTEPVIKTASKTMKITYILTQEAGA